ncbi:MAG TPA: DUF1080 domain-containing protein [Pirellulales bacterium]|nr:DUF1080 domain-containing protein [Pirellulales bacterium]
MPRSLLFIAVVLSTLTLLAGDQSSRALFDGRSLDGWTVRGGTASYKVENGEIVGTTTEGSPNTFLCTNKDYGDFELEFDVKCDPKLNSGCQIRSHVADKEMTFEYEGKTKTIKPGTVFGYQCEVANAKPTSGNFWDEARQARWLDDISGKPGAEDAYKPGEWNHYKIVARGDHIQSWVNGVACADFHDSRDASGLIGLQVHGIKKGTGPYEVRWKNVMVREL